MLINDCPPLCELCDQLAKRTGQGAATIRTIVGGQIAASARRLRDERPQHTEELARLLALQVIARGLATQTREQAFKNKLRGVRRKESERFAATADSVEAWARERTMGLLHGGAV